MARLRESPLGEICPTGETDERGHDGTLLIQDSKAKERQSVCVITVANYCACRIAMLYRCRCDAEPVCARGQVDIQPTADSADNFTPWTGTLGHTCVNFLIVGAVFDCTNLSLCLLRSTILSS